MTDDEPAVPTLSFALFEPLVGTRFAVEIGEPEPLWIELRSAKPLPSHALRGDPFVLGFASADPRRLEQMTHSLSHPALGTFALFLVPVAQDGDGVSYQADFN